MKKVLIILIFLISSLFALQKKVDSTDGWDLFLTIDEFNDEINCHLTTKNWNNINYASIVIFNVNQNNKDMTGYAGSFIGNKLIYRVDKSNSKTLEGIKIDARDYDSAIVDFKEGNYLKFRVYPDNQFAKYKEDKVSLKGFTRLYNLAKKCNYK